MAARSTRASSCKIATAERTAEYTRFSSPLEAQTAVPTLQWCLCWSVVLWTDSPSAVPGRRGWPDLRTVLAPRRSEEHTSELQSLMRISYAVFCLKKKKHTTKITTKFI